VVLNNGSDGPTSHMGLFGGWAANERGHHWMTVDGPGQQASLFLHGLPFRHDWEAVLGPVVDAMAARPDVDPDRIALIGISQGGYWVPRALAFEHRSWPRWPTPGWSTCPPPGPSRCPASCAPSSRTRPRRTPSTRRRGRRHHHPPADHRARGRAVLARPVPGPLRPPARPKQLVKFTAAEGANRHCEPMGLATRDTRIFDWLDRYLTA
jgi:hypothetical protein